MNPSLQELLKEWRVRFSEPLDEDGYLIKAPPREMTDFITRAYELGVAEAKEQVKAICNKSRTERGLARALGNWIEGEK